MNKICLSTRDEMVILDLEKVAYFQANGNYTQVVYIAAKGPLVGIGLSKIESIIAMATPVGKKSSMIRLGRSLIINGRYITEISVSRQRLSLSDNQGNNHVLEAPRQLLKKYKELISKQTKQPE